MAVAVGGKLADSFLPDGGKAETRESNFSGSSNPLIIRGYSGRQGG